MYGFEMIRECTARTNGELVPHPGNLYPTLEDLKKSGFVRVHSVEGRGDRGGRAKVVYELTIKGRKEAERMRDAVLGLLFDAA